MAQLGSVTLVKIGGVLVQGQSDSGISFEQSTLETCETSGRNRWKTIVMDEKQANITLSVHYNDDTFQLFWNAYNEAQLVEVYYGSIEVGEKYFRFMAGITSIQRSDPASGISTFSVSMLSHGDVSWRTVSGGGVEGYALDFNGDYFVDAFGDRFKIYSEM